MRKQVNSWNDITDEEVENVVEALHKTRENVCPVDCDGDYVVEIAIIDRRTCGPSHFFPVPYLDKDEKEHEKALLTNIRMALDAYDKYLRIKEIRNEVH